MSHALYNSKIHKLSSKITELNILINSIDRRIGDSLQEFDNRLKFLESSDQNQLRLKELEKAKLSVELELLTESIKRLE